MGSGINSNTLTTSTTQTNHDEKHGFHPYMSHRLREPYSYSDEVNSTPMNGARGLPHGNKPLIASDGADKTPMCGAHGPPHGNKPLIASDEAYKTPMRGAHGPRGTSHNLSISWWLMCTILTVLVGMIFYFYQQSKIHQTRDQICWNLLMPSKN